MIFRGFVKPVEVFKSRKFILEKVVFEGSKNLKQKFFPCFLLLLRLSARTEIFQIEICPIWRLRMPKLFCAFERPYMGLQNPKRVPVFEIFFWVKIRKKKISCLLLAPHIGKQRCEKIFFSNFDRFKNSLCLQKPLFLRVLTGLNKTQTGARV